MLIQYEFIFDDGRKHVFPVDTERQGKPADAETATERAEKWTQLEYCRCANCPLSPAEHKTCPAAVDLQSVIARFRQENAFQKLSVVVSTPARNYQKRTSLEEGLRSMMGLIMATSGCPILGELKPMANNHVPFSSNDEFVLRTVSVYLLQQYFRMRENRAVDWEMRGLVERSKRLQIVNQALWQRIHAVCEGDSSLKALLSFFSLASSITFSLEAQLLKLRKTLAAPDDDLPPPF